MFVCLKLNIEEDIIVEQKHMAPLAPNLNTIHLIQCECECECLFSNVVHLRRIKANASIAFEGQLLEITFSFRFVKNT